MTNSRTRELFRTPVVLCALFALLYFFFAFRMTDTLVYDYDGLLFETDTAEAAEDITEFQTTNHCETNVHPLFVLLTNPLAQLLQLFFSPTRTVAILNTIWGVLIVLTAYAFFRRIGLTPYRTVLWTILTGASACHMLFASIPERHMPAAWTLTLVCLVAILQPARVWKYILAGILTLGVTVTNFLQCSLLFAVAIFVRNETGPGRWKRFLYRTAVYTVTTLLGAILLSYLQKWLWPDTRLFFLPEGYAEESVFFFVPARLPHFFRKLALLLAHIGLFGIVAPDPAIHWMPSRHMLTFNLDSLAAYSVLGWIAVVIWVSFVVLAFALARQKPRKWLWLQAVAALCVIFNIAMHMIYGDDFFLYTPNWTFFILAGVSTAVFTADLSAQAQKRLNILLTVLVLAVLGNNFLFMQNLTSYFRHGGSEAWRRWQPLRWQAAQNIGAFLQKNKTTTVYTNPNHRWMSFPLQHSIRFVHLAYERSPKIKIEAELDSGGQAYLNSEGGITTFLSATQSAAKRATFGHNELTYDLHPPKIRTEPLPRERLGAVRSSGEQEPITAATDSNLDTFWRGRIEEEADDWLELDLREGRRISGVRIFGVRDHIPDNWRVETRFGAYGEWVTVNPVTPTTAFFWSGPKVFWGGRQQRLECRFNPIPADSLRIVFPKENRSRIPFVAEVEILQTAGDQGQERFPVPDLLTLILARGIGRLYSDRWAANQIHAATAGAVETMIEPHIFEQERSHLPPPFEHTPIPVCLSEFTAWLTLKEDAAATRECLRKWAPPLRETPVGPWILFDIEPGAWRNEKEGYTRLYWKGGRCFFANPNAFTKEKAISLAAAAEAQFRQRAVPGEMEKTLAAALELYPDCQDALILLENLRRREERNEEAEALRARLAELREPAVRAEVKFGKNIRFLGMTPEPPVPGSNQIRIRYLWKMDPSVDPAKWAVFAHFQRNGRTVFQGDHDLLSSFEKEDVARQSPAEILSAVHAHLLPPDMDPGSFDLFLGVYEKATSKRLKPSSDLKIRQNGVIIPNVLQMDH